MLSATTTIRVRYQETDKMGIAYHANYFTWFEVARVYLLDQVGCPYKDLEEEGFFLPVLSCSCEYKSPARFGDLLTVNVSIPEIEQVRIKAHYSILKNDAIIATAKTTHAFVNKLGKVIRPPLNFLSKARNYQRAFGL